MSGRQSIRQLALALFVGAVVALAIDGALQNSLAAVQSPGAASATPWWVIGRVLERGVWVVTALLVWSLAPQLSRIASVAWPADHTVRRAEALDIVGRLMIVVPLVWLLAIWVVSAVRMALMSSWESEGSVFVSGDYYYNVLLGYVPWAGGGMTLLALSRHVSAE
jgi:hypothetical protein